MATLQCACRCLAHDRWSSGTLFNKQPAVAGSSLLFRSYKLSHCSLMPLHSRSGICRLMPMIVMTGKDSHQPAIRTCLSPPPPPTPPPHASSLWFALCVMQFFAASRAASCGNFATVHTSVILTSPARPSYSHASIGCLLGIIQKYASAWSVSCLLTLQKRLQLLWLP